LGSGVILFCLAHAWWIISCILSLVGLLAYKLGTISVGGAFTLCSLFFGRLGGFAPLLSVFSFLCCLIMNRYWNILCWNVRGLNDKNKWSLLRNKIEESGANIFCFQETKRDLIDIHFMKNFAPKRFDNFEFCPSSGASGGILVAWVSRFFVVTVHEKHSFAIRLTFTSVINSISWNLVVVYGPCRQPDRVEFFN
jgi:hypothetical protein